MTQNPVGPLIPSQGSQVGFLEKDLKRSGWGEGELRGKGRVDAGRRNSICKYMKTKRS